MINMPPIAALDCRSVLPTIFAVHLTRIPISLQDHTKQSATRTTLAQLLYCGQTDKHENESGDCSEPAQREATPVSFMNREPDGPSRRLRDLFGRALTINHSLRHCPTLVIVIRSIKRPLNGPAEF